MKYLVVVDVQNDFVTDALGTAEAQAMLPALVEKVSTFEGEVLVTQDTHGEDYLKTQEGEHLPVVHCVKGTPGWELVPQLKEVLPQGTQTFEKPCFGSVELAQKIKRDWEDGKVEQVELVGLCTDICVVSNALLIKAAAPELPVSVDARCCAGVTPQKHEAALATMESCQVSVRR